MRDREPAPHRRTGVAGAILALLALPWTAPPARAVGYGDVDVTVRSEPGGSASHGYAEIEFLVVNRSEVARHEVRLTYPATGYSTGSDYLRSVTRTVTVEPGKTVRVSIAYPERLDLHGSQAAVTIDGRDQNQALSVGGRSRSRGSYRGGSGMDVLVLYSRGVDTRFPDWVRRAEMDSPGRLNASEVVRADQPADQWSPNWLGYTRYDGVVVTADDLRAMPAEVRNALGQYVECGGSLLVLGRDPPLPGPWKPSRDPAHPISVANPGFGRCVVTDQSDFSVDPERVLVPVFGAWSETAAPWRRVRASGEANRVFPVIEDVGIPVKGLLGLMLVFAIVIGPVNLVVLARKKRKLWLFWTVPLVSFITCITVFVYMALTEGWQGRSRVEGVTFLDENTRRASTLGWTGFYTPLVPRSGLHFSPDTELAFQNGEDRYEYRRRGSSGSALTLDWTGDQHLASGWLTPRVPAHFAFRKGELRRERMTITTDQGGAVEAVNGLGADLTEFWYLNERGTLYHATGTIPAGGRATLRPIARPEGPKSLRGVYAGDWATLVETVKRTGPAVLAPRTYLGVLDGAPFLDEGLPGASVRKTKSAIYGILKEGGDGG